MINLLLDKTEKGREEISTRRYHLAPRMRTLLLLFDGKSTTNEVLQKVAGLGIDTLGVTELLEHNFIQIVGEAQPAVTTPLPEEPLSEVLPDAPAPTPEAAPIAQAELPAEAAVLAPGETQMQALHDFFNHTIKKMIGLRGLTLQLKVERANSLDEFRALRQPYLTALEKAIGANMASPFAARLDQLLRDDLPGGFLRQSVREEKP